MSKIKLPVTALLAVALLVSSCNTYKNATRGERGAAIGVGGGAVAGGIIGKLTGNTALGAIIGAAVGGGAGYVIGKKMDQQAEDIKTEVPNAKVQRVEEGIVVEFSSKVLFGFDSYSLAESSKQTLNDLITVLNKYPQTNLEVQGHTDSTGTEQYNMNLSIQRASSVANYLKQSGIASSRLTTKGYGEDDPAYTNSTPEGREENRRVDFLITANQQMKNDAAQQAQQQGTSGQ